MNILVLHQSNSTKFYFIKIDISDFTIDYILIQIKNDELIYLIIYKSKKLNDIILYYLIYKKKLLIINEYLSLI